MRPGDRSWTIRSQPEHVAGRNAGPVGDAGQHGALEGLAHPPQRGQATLGVDGQAPLVDVAVEVYGELRQHHEGLVNAHQDLGDAARTGGVPHAQSPGEAQLAVEPRRSQHPAVGLQGHLAAAGPAGVRTGLDA